ncbi:uncharacterized protein LOC127876687 [Dreissena polymorpha]|nr:uncharacterized protein LOC127876687 [Dreissena polymorpha]
MKMTNGSRPTSLGVKQPTDMTTKTLTSRISSVVNGDASKRDKLSDKPENSAVNSEDISHAQHSTPTPKGDKLTCENLHEENKNTHSSSDAHARTSVVIQTPGYQHVLEDENGKLRFWPYSDFVNSDKLPVKLHRAKKGLHLSVGKGMSGNRRNMTVLQTGERSAERPETRAVRKFHTSTVAPGDENAREVMTAHGDAVQSILLQDKNGNAISDEELAKILPKIAESISKMDTKNAEEILPGITQNITQLQNGGNLVITTMTRRLDEDESSSGQASPAPDYPLLDADDVENGTVYLVRDSKGGLFYVEDVTSETQESAYFSSSRNNSDSLSDGAYSPVMERGSKLQSTGISGIDHKTAHEILSAMYGDDVQELTENEEEWSERTYEFDIPKKGTEYSKSSFRPQYMVEEPSNAIHQDHSIQLEHAQSAYQSAARGGAWIFDGGMAQNYSQMTQYPVGGDDAASISTASVKNADATGTRVIERYTLETETTDYPMIPLPLPVPLPQPHMLSASAQSTTAPGQYSLVSVDVTPMAKTERTHAAIEGIKPQESKEMPIYKTVATIQTGGKLPAQKTELDDEKTNQYKKYRIVSSKATENKSSAMTFNDVDYKYSNENVEYKRVPHETQNETENKSSSMTFNDVDYKYSTENVEYKRVPHETQTQFFVRNSTHVVPQSSSSYRTEKKIELGGSSDKKYKSEIQVRNAPEVAEERYAYDDMRAEMGAQQMNSTMRAPEVAEERYAYDDMRAKMGAQQMNSTMRVVRGSYLIKNTLDDVDATLDDNINMFDGKFELCKDNPMYHSDEDLRMDRRRSAEERSRRQERFNRDLSQDITFETVDKYSKTKTVKREPERPRQSISELLLDRLSLIDSRHIRQTIDVKHDHEDIYGDPRFLHADGEASYGGSSTSNFDTVGEKVDLLLKDGKAYITVKVTAERVTPVDLEFNVWRKNQAIVTRTIEVDLLATEERRRLYYKVMESHGGGGSGSSRGSYRANAHETVLDGPETLALFTRILGAAEGEGDKEDIEVRTRLGNTRWPNSAGADMMY